MNTPVSYSIAKLLKEKGFDKPTHSFYVIDESEYGEIEEFITNPNDNYPTLDDNSLFDTLASAPTIAEVVMWLFESHNIWIYLTRDSVTNTFGPVINTETKSIYFNNQSTVSRVTGQKYDPWYNKPENGYQKAIEYVLTEMI